METALLRLALVTALQAGRRDKVRWQLVTVAAAAVPHGATDAMLHVLSPI